MEKNSREFRDRLKEQIIENWCIHMQQDYDRGEIVNYVEEDHVDDIGQAGFYNLNEIDWEMLKKQKATLLQVIDENNSIERNYDLNGILDIIEKVQEYAVDVMGVDEEKVIDKNKVWGTHHKDNVEKIVVAKLAALGMDMPDNLEDIVQFVYEDIIECSYPDAWTETDVVIALRSWMEKVTEQETSKSENLQNNLEKIQSTLDDLQNESEGVLEKELYDRLYTLRCDIQGQLDDLNEK